MQVNGPVRQKDSRNKEQRKAEKTRRKRIAMMRPDLNSEVPRRGAWKGGGGGGG